MTDADKEPYVRAHEKALVQHDAAVAAYEKGKGISPTAEKPKTEKATKEVKPKDVKPAAQSKPANMPKLTSTSKAKGAVPVAHVSDASESSGSESSDESDSTGDESGSEAPPPKKPKVVTKPAPPAKGVKKDTKSKEKK